MWSKETPDKYCHNNTYGGKNFAPLQCQELCETDSSCVGIAWSSVGSQVCYLCQNDTLSDAANGYGFYRNPFGNNEVQAIC